MLFWIIALGLMGEPDTERVNPVRPNFQTPWDQLQDVQDMTAAINRQYKAWIDHDIDGYLAAFWRSPFLIYIIDSTIVVGWDEVSQFARSQYPDWNDSGTPVLENLDVNTIDSDTAITLEVWTIKFKAYSIHGNTSSTWRKMSEGWRIVEAHTSYNAAAK